MISESACRMSSWERRCVHRRCTHLLPHEDIHNIDITLVLRTTTLPPPCILRTTTLLRRPPPAGSRRNSPSCPPPPYSTATYAVHRPTPPNYYAVHRPTTPRTTTLPPPCILLRRPPPAGSRRNSPTTPSTACGFAEKQPYHAVHRLRVRGETALLARVRNAVGIGQSLWVQRVQVGFLAHVLAPFPGGSVLGKEGVECWEAVNCREGS